MKKFRNLLKIVLILSVFTFGGCVEEITEEITNSVTQAIQEDDDALTDFNDEEYDDEEYGEDDYDDEDWDDEDFDDEDFDDEDWDDEDFDDEDWDDEDFDDEDFDDEDWDDEDFDDEDWDDEDYTEESENSDLDYSEIIAQGTAVTRKNIEVLEVTYVIDDSQSDTLANATIEVIRYVTLVFEKDGETVEVEAEETCKRTAVLIKDVNNNWEVSSLTPIQVVSGRIF